MLGLESFWSQTISRDLANTSSSLLSDDSDVALLSPVFAEKVLTEPVRNRSGARVIDAIANYGERLVGLVSSAFVIVVGPNS